MFKTTDDLDEFKNKSNDQIDWKKMGKDMEIVEVLENTNKGKSDQGLGFKILIPLRSAFRTQRTQGSWPGNFKPGGKGMRLLFTDGHGGPITIAFDKPVKGVGAQIQEHYGIDTPPANGAPFTAVIRAFKKGKPIEGPFTAHGWSDNGLHQAVFVGVYDEQAANIDSIQFDTIPIDSHDMGDFAIGRVYLIV
jgi:hypothetical protein